MTALAALDNVRVHFAAAGGATVRAVQDVSLAVAPGGTVGLVGESGSGKSTAGRALLRLVPLTAGRVWFEGADITDLRGASLRRVRRRAQPVLQDPRGAFDPRLTVGASVAEPLLVHESMDRRTAMARVAELLEAVGLAVEYGTRRPAELSGGQLQRAAIARALACEPRLLVLDEPISALDVSVAGQILNLLLDLRADRELAYLFIGHDLASVGHVCQTIAVMYFGRIVEQGPTALVLDQPAHPYTQALVAASAGSHRDAPPLAGEPPNPLDPPTGCALHPRCPLAIPRCRDERPEPRPVGDRLLACHKG